MVRYIPHHFPIKGEKAYALKIYGPNQKKIKIKINGYELWVNQIESIVSIVAEDVKK